MKLRMLALLSCSALLAACGGGGGETSSGGVSAPSPSPSPSPSPTPSPSYTAYANLTGDQSFGLICQSIIQGNGATYPGPPLPLGGDPGATLAYDASADSYTFSTYGVDQTFGPADVDASIANVERAYAKPEEGTGIPMRLIIAAPEPGGTATDYVRGAYVFVRNTNTGDMDTYDCVFGVPTLLNDRPSQTTVTFTDFAVRGTFSQSYPDGTRAFYSLTASNPSLSVNLSTGVVKPSVSLTGRLTSKLGNADVPTSIDFGTFSGETTMDGERQGVGGLFNWEDFSYQAPYEGWFFGPQGAEAAFTASVRHDEGDGRITLGTFTFVAAR